MVAKLEKEARLALIAAVSVRYKCSSRLDKVRILDEFVAITGFHRKYATRVLNSGGEDPKRAATPKRRDIVYDEAVREALVVLWEASDRICGKRLKPLLPTMIAALQRHGHLNLDDVVREKLLVVSASTIDRLLVPARSTQSRKKKRTVPLLKAQVPVRTFGDWNDPAPGFVEMDLVAHCGGSMGGSFVHTLVMTDIATGWTECLPLAVRDASLVVDGLQKIREVLPFELRGIDTDNGSEFLNETMINYCSHDDLEFTRSRPYRKNDQAWVEQKNGAVVRRLVGYGRLEGIAAAQALARLYGSSRLFVNFFQPSFKLLEKRREGAKVRKKYDTPQTPCARLLARKDVDEVTKTRLQAVTLTLDPLKLLDEIRAVQHHIAGLAKGEELHVLPHRDADLDRFLASLSTAWRAGEVRPTHQEDPRPDRYWRTREDPFAEVWSQVVVWLETDPDATPKNLFERLRTQSPGTFVDGQLRTLQRRVKDWRSLAARRLVFAPEGTRWDGNISVEASG